MSVTLDTSHFEMSPLNENARWNVDCMLVTAETFQDPIGPCGPLEQSLDSCRHSLMAARSCAFDFETQPAVGHYYSVTRPKVSLGSKQRVRGQCEPKDRDRLGTDGQY